MPVPVVLGLLAITGVCPTACRYDDPVAPRVTHPIAVASVVGGDSLCGKVSFKINSATSVDVTYPNRSTCGTGLKVIRGSGSTYSEASSRTLTVNLAVLNQGTVPVQLPVRLLVPSNGVSGIVPSGNPATKIVPLNPDSSPAGGGKVWLVGGTGTLNVGDSTALKGVQFQVQSPVTQATFSFQATAQDAGPPPVPATMNLPRDSTYTARLPANPRVRYYRNILGVVFDDTTSATTIQSIFQQFSATVIGGAPHMGTKGAYLIRVPDPGPTYASIDALRGSLGAHGGVRLAFTVTYSGAYDPRGRFPTDGAGGGRSDWLPGGSGSLSAWRSVRAPLAWGCENGTYGPTKVKVGIVDFNFDSNHPDFHGSTVHLILPPPGDSTLPDSFLTDNTIDAGTGLPRGQIVRSHGTGVAGIVAAEGDNGQGIAGMVWNADLYLFAYGRDTLDAVIEPIVYWSTIVDSAIKLGINVLMTSTPMVGDSGSGAMELNLARFLSASSKNMIILPTADTAVTIPVSQLGSSTASYIGPMDRAAAQQFGFHPDQVIFVAGSDGAGGVYSNGAVWSGGSRIAAPAVAVKTLARNSFSGGVGVRSGNSYAAPFVAGAVAELLSMDTMLTATDITSYLLRGDTLGTVDPITGQYHSAPALNGATGLYQLNPYGALTLLSREQPNTPICGYPVRIDGATGQNLTLEKAGNDSVVYHFQNASYGSVSVAQGGRLIALNPTAGAQISPFFPVTVIDHLGTVVTTLPSLVRREFLERDTADVRVLTPPDPSWLTGPVRLDIRGPGRSSNDLDQHIFEPFKSGDVFQPGFLVVGPTGNDAAIATYATTYVPCATDGGTQLPITLYRSYLIHLGAAGSSSPVQTGTVDVCAPRGPGEFSGLLLATFAHDGTRALFGAWYDDPDLVAGGELTVRTLWSLGDVATGTSTPIPTAQGSWALDPYLSADDVTFRSYDEDVSNNNAACWDRQRLLSAPTTIIGTASQVPLAACTGGPRQSSQPNLIARGGRGARLRQARSGWQAAAAQR